MKDKKYYNCMQYPGYIYTKNGEFWHKDPLYRITPKLLKTGEYIFEFDLNGIHHTISCVHLFMELYFGGTLDLPIRYRDANPWNFDSENLYYDIPLSKMAQFESPFTKFVNLGGHLFKRIEKYPNYFISEYGLVYGIWWKKIMVLVQDKDGYYFVRLAGNGKKKNCRINRLVYETFVGNIPSGFIVDHYDGIKIHNHIENLTAMHSDDNSLKGHTFDIRRDDISDDDVSEICIGIQSGLSLEEIFAKNSIGPIFITLQSFTNFCLGLIRGYYFRHITKNYDLRNFHYYGNGLRKYLPSQIEDVCQMIESGTPKSVISYKLGIPMSIIKNVYNRNSWKEISNKYSF